ncbi:TDT family transporter [Brassicibacter mesophilus]|uniref:TDT family transporter n=1 Tax=Brassicibacter mesophilus TaxID=745119 RepID=UPI003D1938B8
MTKVIKKLPIPIAGLMLALAAKGNLVLSYGSVYRNIFGSISAILFILLIMKAITNPKSVSDGLNSPVVASVMPTFSMGMMLLATYLKPYLPSLSFYMWIVAIVLHCIFIIVFTKRYIFKFDIKKVFPSYFVVYVGIVVASVTAPAFNMLSLGQYIFWFGFVSYLVLLPIVLYRVFAVRAIPEPALPTLVIFAAPASLCLAGYINSFQQKSMAILSFLTALSLLMLACVLLYFPKLLKLKFYPSYSAFTFPLVISAIAIKLTNGFLVNAGKVTHLKYIVKIEELLAVSVVIYVLVRYTQFLFTD